MEPEKYEITLDIKAILAQLVDGEENLEAMYQEAKSDESCGFGEGFNLTHGEFYLGYFMKVAGTLEQFGLQFQVTPGMDEPSADLISSAYVMTQIAEKFIQKYVPKMALELALLRSGMQKQIDYGQKFSPKAEDN